MKTILTIGYQIPGFSHCHNNLKSNISMLDGDVIVFCPDMIGQYHTDDYFDGKLKLTETSSREIERDSNHWRTEIIEALKADKTVFVFLAEKEEYSVFSHQDFSGTGKSRSTTNYYSPYDNYNWVPLSKFSVTSVKGKRIQKPKQTEFLTFFNSYKSELSYDVVIESDSIDPIFFTSTGSRIVGGRAITKSGNLIFIPYPKYSINEFTSENDEGQNIWSEEALKWGDKLVSHLLEIDKAVTLSAGKTPPPDWVFEDIFTLKKEKILASKRKSLEDKIATLNEKLILIQEKLSAELEIKNLLFEGGKPLENSVTMALRVLGYNAEGYDDGTLELDQLIVSPEGERYIGECEGKDNRAIDITKFRQLADAINEDFERDEVSNEAVGILFGNPHRLLKPADRKDYFTKKCLDGAKRRGYALVKIPDLFNVTKYLLENNNKSYQKKCREAIKNGLGNIVKFPKVPKK